MASEILERSLYNGLFPLIHNPNARGSSPRYKIMSADGTSIASKPKGVTTILGKVISKDLMGWAVDCAVEYLKAKLPVVTQKDLDEAALAYTVKRDAGASTGTEAHALVEAFLKKGNVEIQGASQEAQNATNAFIKWFNEAKPEIINVEEVIYSKEFQFAGTYDCMLKIDDKVYLCDLKTTNSSRKASAGVYAENYLQLGAYALAHDEQREYEEANGGTTLLPIEGLMVISCKKNGKLDVITEAELGLTVEDCKTMFKRVMNLFTFLNYTTDKLGGR